MRLTIAYSKIKKRNQVLINNATYQRETLSEWPIRQPLTILKGIFSDSYNIILWHESEDINKKRLFPKLQLIPILCLQVVHDYVCFIALLCWIIIIDNDLLPTEMISAQYLREMCFFEESYK